MNSEPLPSDRLEELLRRLPFTMDRAPDDSLDVSGVLVRSNPGVVSILTEGYCLTFDIADVVGAVEVTAEDENPSLVPVVHLTLRGAARLLKVERWTEFENRTSGLPRPFALAVRTQSVVLPPDGSFRSMEERFILTLEK